MQKEKKHTHHFPKRQQQEQWQTKHILSMLSCQYYKQSDTRPRRSDAVVCKSLPTIAHLPRMAYGVSCHCHRAAVRDMVSKFSKSTQICKPWPIAHIPWALVQHPIPHHHDYWRLKNRPLKPVLSEFNSTYLLTKAISPTHNDFSIYIYTYNMGNTVGLNFWKSGGSTTRQHGTQFIIPCVRRG